MSRPRLLIPGLVVLAWLTLGGSALAGLTTVPFSGGMDARGTVQNMVGHLVIVESNATSSATSPVKFSAKLEFSVDLSSPVEAFGGAITFTLTATGEQVYAIFVGQYFAPGQFTGALYFAGGTGRFKTASGKGTLSGIDAVENGMINPLDFHADFNATLTYKN